MKMISSLLLLALSATVTKAHNAIDCFQDSVIFGELAIDEQNASDIDFLTKIDLDHELTSIKVCTNRQVTYIKGIQASYGKFTTNGEITEAVSFNPYGDVDYATSLCTIFYIPQDDFLTGLTIRYDATTVTQVWLRSSKGKSVSYGKANTSDETVPLEFSEETFMFHGFTGRARSEANDELASLGIVRYDAVCVAKERLRQGGKFTWGITNNQFGIGIAR